MTLTVVAIELLEEHGCLDSLVLRYFRRLVYILALIRLQGLCAYRYRGGPLHSRPTGWRFRDTVLEQQLGFGSILIDESLRILCSDAKPCQRAGVGWVAHARIDSLQFLTAATVATTGEPSATSLLVP